MPYAGESVLVTAARDGQVSTPPTILNVCMVLPYCTSSLRLLACSIG